MKTVLVADDDVISRKVVKCVCEGLGYKVLESDNGEKALQMIKNKHRHFNCAGANIFFIIIYFDRIKIKA